MIIILYCRHKLLGQKKKRKKREDENQLKKLAFENKNTKDFQFEQGLRNLLKVDYTALSEMITFEDINTISTIRNI